MEIEFDPNKSAANQLKHHISLEFAKELQWESALVWIDERNDYGEVRMIALVPHSNVIHCAVFVDRDNIRRIISLRRANRREVKHYAQNI